MQRGLPCRNNQEERRWILAGPLCVCEGERCWVTAAGASSSVSRYSFTALSSHPAHLCLAFSCLFLDAICPFPVFPHLFHLYFFHIVSTKATCQSTQQPQSCDSRAEYFLLQQHYCEALDRCLRLSVGFGLPLCPWVTPVATIGLSAPPPCGYNGYCMDIFPTAEILILFNGVKRILFIITGFRAL